MTVEERILKARILRNHVALTKMKAWGVGIDNNIAKLGVLLRFKNSDGTIINNSDITDKQIQMLKALDGPHGYSIYKALTVQMKNSPDVYVK